MCSHTIIVNNNIMTGHGVEKRKIIPIGVDDFKKIRENEYYFVDKSELISDILSDGAEVFLFTRPRRFGKSLNLSMLDAFFNLKYKGNEWFDGLKVSDYENTKPHKNTYPVIYFDMKDLTVDSFESFVEDMSLKISMLFQKSDLNEFLDRTSPEIADIYERGRAQKLNLSELRKSIAILSKAMHDCYGARPIILIDEYDNPMNNCFNKRSFDRILSFLQIFYSSMLKSNEHMSFAVITGVMHIGKESVFPGLNNVYVNNIFSKGYDERYGFTASEMMDLCTYYGRSDKFDEAKEWYDGYRFGNAEVYNPWSALNYIKNGFEPKPYWSGTSSNDIIDTLLLNSDLTVRT